MQQSEKHTNIQRNWKIAGTGDFDGDGKTDILWRKTSTGDNTIWKSANRATEQAVTSMTDQNWKMAGTGDFDGDGKDDILWRNFATGANVIWKSANSATTLAVTSLSDQSWKVAGVGDFNGDGVDDILWRNSSTGVNAIWSAGNSANLLAVAAVANLNYAVAAVGDYNGDGRADIAWRNATAGSSVIWSAGNSATTIALTGMTDINWTNPAQTNTGLNALGEYLAMLPSRADGVKSITDEWAGLSAARGSPYDADRLEYLGSLEQFKTSEGNALLESQVQNLVSAMAGFAPLAAGQTTLSASYATTLSSVLVANWV